MDTDMDVLNGPWIVVDCPWCGGPVELGPRATTLQCRGCSTVVELARDPERTVKDATPRPASVPIAA